MRTYSCRRWGASDAHTQGKAARWGKGCLKEHWKALTDEELKRYWEGLKAVERIRNRSIGTDTPLRQAYLAALPPALSEYLAACPFVRSFEVEEVQAMFRLLDSLERVLSDRKPRDFRERQFVQEEELLAAAQGVGAEHDEEEAYFYPSQAGLLFLVRFGWFRQNLNVLLDITLDNHYSIPLGAVARNNGFGLLISEFVGCDSSDPESQDVVVLELATWGFSR